MRRKVMWILVPGAVIVGAAVYVGNVLATPASGYVGSTIAMAHFDDIDVFNQLLVEAPPGSRPRKSVWHSLQKTKGPSDLYVQSNVWALGGSTGWHTHPAHSLIIVTAGTVTAYDRDDPSCTPHPYAVGSGFVDPGGGHVHLLRNEGVVEARTVAVQLIPQGATRRIDAEGTAACPF